MRVFDCRSIVAAVGCLAIAICGCGGEQPVSSDEKVSDGEITEYQEPPEVSPPANPAPPADAPVAVTLSEDQLPSGYEARETFAKEHQGDVVEVTATVFDLGVMRPGFGDLAPYVRLCALKDKTQPHSASNVDLQSFLVCYTPGVLPWNQCDVGCQVTLRGTPDPEGYFNHCTITSTECEPVAAFTDQEFLTAYKQAPKEFAEKHKDKGLIVRGKIAGFKGEGDDARPYFQGVDDTTIGVDYAYRDQFEDLKVGDEIAVISTLYLFAVTDEDKQVVSLGDCQRIDLVKER